jgi:hypothetical protein
MTESVVYLFFSFRSLSFSFFDKSKFYDAQIVLDDEPPERAKAYTASISSISAVPSPANSVPPSPSPRAEDKIQIQISSDSFPPSPAIQLTAPPQDTLTQPIHAISNDSIATSSDSITSDMLFRSASASSHGSLNKKLARRSMRGTVRVKKGLLEVNAENKQEEGMQKVSSGELAKKITQEIDYEEAMHAIDDVYGVVDEKPKEPYPFNWREGEREEGREGEGRNNPYFFNSIQQEEIPHERVY